MPFDLKPGSLFFIVMASAISGLLFGSELVRLLIAAALALVAVPFWVSTERSFFSRALNKGEHTLDSILANLTENDDHQATP